MSPVCATAVVRRDVCTLRIFGVGIGNAGETDSSQRERDFNLPVMLPGTRKLQLLPRKLPLARTKLLFLAKNTTILCPPADSFVIQKIKSDWMRKWDKMELEMIEKKNWVYWKDGSGELAKSGKRFYLMLAASVVREVSNSGDCDKVLYCRKAMIGCGIALNLNGRWKKQQLFPHLPTIVEKYPENFNGKPGADSKRSLEE